MTITNCHQCCSISNSKLCKNMFIQFLLVFLGFLATTCSAQESENKLVCYYDSKANFRDGQAQFELNFLTEPLQICTHLIYGFAGINKDTYKLESLNSEFDINRNYYREFTNLKRSHPGLRMLLSVGGGRDDQNPEKYLTLLETIDNRHAFVSSATNLLKANGFDGLDLAWQFPQNKPKKVYGFWGSTWNKIKTTFVDSSSIDSKAGEHKQDFVALVEELRRSFNTDGLLLTLSVPPNVNSSLFHAVGALAPQLDFINLWAFDYYTPKRNPSEADYSAPLYEVFDRKYDENGNYLVQYWLQHGAPNNKLIFGIPTFARSWKMTHNSGVSGVPPISDANGAGDPGPYTKEPGLLSYQELCARLENPDHIQAGATLRKIRDPTEKYGMYAFQPEDISKQPGTWVSYEDPDVAGIKTIYARTKGLGGVAIVDLTLDDFRGLCTGNKYPILRAIKFRL